MNKLQARTELTRRLKEHFGDRARQIIEIAGDPHEGSFDDVLYLVVVLASEGYDYKRDRHEAIDVSSCFDGDVDFEYMGRVYVTSERELENGSTPAARAAQAGGVLA